MAASPETPSGRLPQRLVETDGLDSQQFARLLLERRQWMREHGLDPNDRDQRRAVEREA